MGSTTSFSLLFPPGTGGSYRISDEVSADFGLDSIAEQFCGEGIDRSDALDTLLSLVLDRDAIEFRQDVFFELASRPELADGLGRILPKIRELTVFNRTAREADSPVLHAIWRLGELDLFVECVTEMSTVLDRNGASVRSAGLRGLRDLLRDTTANDAFRSLVRELPKLREGLKRKRSVTIGINLDERMRPFEATLISVNETPFRERTLLGDFFSETNPFTTPTTLFRNPSAETLGFPSGSRVPLSPLFQDIDVLLKSIVRPIIKSIDGYLRVETEFIRRVAPELGFYLGGVRFMRRLVENGLPVCRPVIRGSDERVLRARELYNVQLALRFLAEKKRRVGAEIVGNDIDFSDDARLFVLTGPNQGGKTTFLQAVGLAHICAQAGLFVPAASAEISPVDAIATHFPAEEKGRLETGRLGEEAARLSSMFSTITRHSLVLLNESLSSTGPGDGYYLAGDVLCALRVLGARGVFATHLHELASRIDELNTRVGGESRIASLVAQTVDGSASGSAPDGEPATRAVRTFRIVRSEPEGKSYARDVASRYGISYDQLVGTLKKRGVL